MESIYQYIDLDFSQYNLVTIPVMEGEIGGLRTVVVSLFNNGQPYVISNISHTNAYVIGTKFDDTNSDQNCTILDDSTLQFSISDQMQAVAGDSTYCIKLIDIDTNNYIKSFPFVIHVEKTAENISTINSSNEFKVLNDLIVLCKNVLNDASNVNVAFNDYTSETPPSLSESISSISSNQNIPTLFSYVKASLMNLETSIGTLNDYVLDFENRITAIEGTYGDVTDEEIDSIFA